ncbi:MAG: Hsp20/alpha crystallin family protein [Armatimonadetes bacterium]|nr:Hsp20/alpha crystallin family protein [Armatimonadota bacterium]
MNLLLSRDVHDLRGRMNRLFEEPDSPRAFRPAVDVAEDAHEIVLQVELPGMKKEDIDIQLTGDTLRLSGQRRREEHERGEHFHRIERSYGAFSRTFQIETPIDAANVSADYQDGVLTLKLPKQEAVKPRQIPINA